MFLSNAVVGLSIDENGRKSSRWGITDAGGLEWERFELEQIPERCGADVNDDGEVDVMDLLLISAA